VGTSYALLYTVPSGKRTILKSVVALNGAAASNVLFVSLRNPSGEYAVFAVVMGSNSSDTRCAFVAPWIVLNASDTVYVIANAASVQVVMSGAELTLPA
jgi:hypothetical protein